MHGGVRVVALATALVLGAVVGPSGVAGAGNRLAGDPLAGEGEPLKVDFANVAKAEAEGFERIGSTVGAESTLVDGVLRVSLELGTAPLVPDPNGPPVRRYPDGVEVSTTIRSLEGPNRGAEGDVRAGVLCMTSEQGEDGFYAFFAEPDGGWQIVKWAPLGAPKVLKEGRRRPKKSDGDLTVRATCDPASSSAELTLSIFGEEVATAVDRDPLDWDYQVGLVVEQPDAVTTEPVVAEFAKMRAVPLGD